MSPTAVVYGLHPVLAVLRAGRRKVYKLWTANNLKPNKMAPVLRLARKSGLEAISVSSTVIEKMAGGGTHQGILIETEPYKTIDLEKLITTPSPGPGHPMILMLDGMVDPHNLGALVRTAVGINIQGVIIPKKGAARPTASVMKASSGALEYVDLIVVPNLVNALKRLKKSGYWVFGLAPEASHNLYDCDLTTPLVMVIGGEERGLRPLVSKHCDTLVSIPQLGPVESLNASVAGAVVMYEALRQRLD